MHKHKDLWKKRGKEVPRLWDGAEEPTSSAAATTTRALGAYCGEPNKDKKKKKKREEEQLKENHQHDEKYHHHQGQLLLLLQLTNANINSSINMHLYTESQCNK